MSRNVIVWWQTNNASTLSWFLSLLDKKSGKVHLHFRETWAGKPRAHTKNCRCDAWKCDIVPQIKVNPSKATRFFFALCEQSLARTRTHKPSGHSLFEQHVPIKSYLPSHPRNLSLRAYITGLTDSAGAESLPQLWRSVLVSNTDLCAISHRWFHFHTASQETGFTSEVEKQFIFDHL